MDQATLNKPTKQNVLETRKMLGEAGITEQRDALCSAAGQAFYNASKFTLRDLRSRGSQQRLLPLLEDGGIEAFIRRQVLPCTPDTWIKEDAILAIEKEAEGLLDGFLKVGASS